MAKNDVIKVNVSVEFQCDFHGYDTKQKNDQAVAAIRKQVKTLLEDNAAFISFFIEDDDEVGLLVEDTTRNRKVRVVSCTSEKRNKDGI